MVLRQALVSGPITALAAALTILGGTRQALAVDARRVRNPLVLHQRGP